MNDDMPWVNLTQEEVEELRNKKHELTEYGKQRLKELMRNQEPYPDEFFEEAERREKSNRVLQRYNDFYNLECSGLPHGTPITPEHQQMITLQSMIDALRCENLNREYNEIAINDIENLIEALYQQSITFLERVKEFKDSADGVA
jgi:DNA-binding PadR family transcriptional regulator